MEGLSRKELLADGFTSDMEEFFDVRKNGVDLAHTNIEYQQLGQELEKIEEYFLEKPKGTFIKPNKLTFAEWLDTWLNEYVKQQVRSTTFTDYNKWVKNHIKPGLGHICLKDLQPSQIQKFYNQKLTEPKLNGRPGTLSPRSVRYLHVLIHECLEQALKEGLIIRNSAKATRPPKTEKKEAAYLTTEQITAFLEEIAEDRLYAALIAVLGTGLRLGELAALKWSNVDLKKGILYVKEAVSRVDTFEGTGPRTKLIFQLPKTKKSLRSKYLSRRIF